MTWDGGQKNCKKPNIDGGSLRNPETRTPILCFFAYLTISHTSRAVLGTHVMAGVLLTVLPQF